MAEPVAPARPGEPFGPVPTKGTTPQGTTPRRLPSDDISDQALDLFVRFCRLNPTEITERTDVVRRVLDAYAEAL